jgi:hypothetical protein
MRTTVTLDDDVYEAALNRARVTSQSLGRVLSDMARQAMQRHRQAHGNRGGAGRFAAFDVPWDAGVILASRIQEALDGDGLCQGIARRALRE